MSLLTENSSVLRNNADELVYGLGLRYKNSFYSVLKSNFLDFLINKFLDRSVFSKLKKKANEILFLKAKESLLDRSLEQVISFFQSNNPEGNFVVFTEGGCGEKIVDKIAGSSLKSRLWAHYDLRHKKFNSFSRSLAWLGTDNTYAPVKYVLFLIHPSRYEYALRLWKYELKCPWCVVLPFYSKGSHGLNEFEDPNPTLLWVMQYSGTGRLAPVFSKLASFYGRDFLPEMNAHSFSTRTICNLKRAGGEDTHDESDKIKKHMEWEAGSYKSPSRNFLTEYVKTKAEILPYFSWMLVHEFIDYGKLKDISGLKSVVLLRDPRDMLVSAYYRGNFNPHLMPDGYPHEYIKSRINPEIFGMDSEEFKRQCLWKLAKGGVFCVCPTYFLNWPSIKELVRSFLEAKKSDKVYCLKLEDLHKDPESNYRSLIEWLNWNPKKVIPSDLLAQFIQLGTFVHQLGKNIDSKEKSNTTRISEKSGLALSARNGSAGQWKLEFSPDLIDWLKSEIGQELIDLGYETNLDWKQ